MFEGLKKIFRYNEFFDFVQEFFVPSRRKFLRSKAKFTINSLYIGRRHIMDLWEDKYMKMLAAIVTKNGGNILEIGYGLGLSAGYIQNKRNVKKHVVVECHPEVIKKCRERHKYEIANGSMLVIKGFWQKKLKNMPDESFDGILFDPYPLKGDIRYNFPKEAYRLLKKGGILTYYSDEPHRYSKKHMRLLKDAGFKKIEYKICNVNPPIDCDYYDYNTIIAPIVIK